MRITHPFSILVLRQAFCLAVTVMSGIASGFAVAQTGDVPTPHTLSLNVDLVVLNVTVLNRKHEFVSGLEKKHFRVYENGKLQSVRLFQNAEVPVTVGLVIDNSGSMRTKRDEVNAAALAFVESSHPEDEVFVVNFNDDARLGLAPLLFSSNLGELRRALSRWTAVGQTALYDAIRLALDHLKKGHHDKKTLLVISDGGDNASKIGFEQLLSLAQRSEAAIYAIGLYDPESRERNPVVLKRLAQVSGGESFFPASVADIHDICRRVAKTIRSQYTLGYSPSDAARDGTYRSILVTASAPRLGNLAVRTREGYFAPKESRPAAALVRDGRECP